MHTGRKQGDADKTRYGVLLGSKEPVWEYGIVVYSIVHRTVPF